MLAVPLELLYTRLFRLAHQIVPREYEYTQHNGQSRMLDVYTPKLADTPAPVIVFLHGGAWQIGSKRNLQSALVRQLFRGYALVGVNYSFSQHSQWPTQLYEVKAAIRWLRAHATALNLNPDCIILWGISAGGHIGNVVGASTGLPEMEGQLGHANQSSAVQGVISWYGPSDFLRLGTRNPLAGRSFRLATMKLLGASPENYTEKARLANPINFINPHTPPFFLQHGSWDHIVHHNQSEMLYHALRDAGVPVQYQLFPTYVHADIRFNAAKSVAAIEAFLDGIVKQTKDEEL